MRPGGFDCLIVGGGVIGLSLAYELARCGRRIHVIDRAQPGREASWAGAGILPAAGERLAVHPLDQLRALTHRLHPIWAQSLREETGIDTGYRRCGALYLARSRGEAAAILAFVRSLQEEGLETQSLSEAELGQLEPALVDAASGSWHSAYRVPAESQLRNPDHLRALQAACTARGVQISPGVEATGFDVSGGLLNAVFTHRGPLAAEQFCLTSGAWTRLLLEQLGIPTGMLPVRGQMVMFQAPRQLFRHVINEGPRYLVPREDGRVLVGSSEEEVGFDKRTTDEVVRDLIHLGRQLVPALNDALVEKTWAGLRPGSFDGFPYLGSVPGLANAWVAAGHFRSGLYLSPATAVVMGRLICGQNPQLDLSPFRVGRG